MESKNRPFYVLGAGLYGCLVAWKIKNKNRRSQVVLVEPFGRLMKSFDPIQIGSLNCNNGFHGIELPRASRLGSFLENRLGLKLVKQKAVKKLLIQGEIVDYTDKIKEYPANLQKLFKLKAGLSTNNNKKFLRAISINYLKVLKKISLRYSQNFNEAKHLLIPWFFPANYIYLGKDEGRI